MSGRAERRCRIEGSEREMKRRRASEIDSESARAQIRAKEREMFSENTQMI